MSIRLQYWSYFNIYFSVKQKRYKTEKIDGKLNIFQFQRDALVEINVCIKRKEKNILKLLHAHNRVPRCDKEWKTRMYGRYGLWQIDVEWKLQDNI